MKRRASKPPENTAKLEGSNVVVRFASGEEAVYSTQSQEWSGDGVNRLSQKYKQAVQTGNWGPPTTLFPP